MEHDTPQVLHLRSSGQLQSLVDQADLATDGVYHVKVSPDAAKEPAASAVGTPRAGLVAEPAKDATPVERSPEPALPKLAPEPAAAGEDAPRSAPVHLPQLVR